MNAFARIVEQRFGLSPEAQTPLLTAQDISTWDSMNFLLLIADLENEYNFSFTMDEVLSISSLGQLRQVLEDHGIAL